MTTINERALLMGWVCSRRLMAPARQNPAKRTNKIRCIEVEGESFPIVNVRDAIKMMASFPAELASQVPKCEGPGAPASSAIGQPEACTHNVEDGERHQKEASEGSWW